MSEEEIDSFKEIPVGYRIKLRKFLKERNNAEKNQSSKKLISTMELPVIKNDSKEIEDIIKSR